MAKYLNFPIELLKTIFIDCKDCMNNIINYSIYLKAKQDYEEVGIEEMNDIAEELGITLTNTQNSLNLCIAIENSISSNVPMTGIRTSIIFDYYKNDKTEFQIAVFCAFCAVRSILGKKTYCKTNKEHIHARMFGFNTIGQLPNSLNSIQAKYDKRYHIDKVLEELQLNWGLKAYSEHNRGFYLSFDLPLKELAIICLKAKNKTKQDDLKLQKKLATEYAKNSLNKGK